MADVERGARVTLGGGPAVPFERGAEVAGKALAPTIQRGETHLGLGIPDLGRSAQLAVRIRSAAFARRTVGAHVVAGVTLGRGEPVPAARFVGVEGYPAAFAIELDIEDPPPRIVLIPIATALTLFFSVPAAALSGTLTMKAMAQATDIQERLRSYIFFKIMAAALCEGPALVWSVLVMLTGNHLYLIGTGFGLLLLAALFPTPDGLETKLGRSAAQVDEELRADDANS